MEGKHSAGEQAQKHTPVAKILLIAVIAVAAVAAVTGCLVRLFAAEPLLEEISGEEAVLAAGEAPDELQAPEEEPAETVLPAAGAAEDMPGAAAGTAVEESPDEVKVPEEEPEEFAAETGPEAPGAAADLPVADFAAIYESAGIEPVYQLAARNGEGYAVFARGDATRGISQYEYLYEGDTVVAIVETHYAFHPDSDGESLALEAEFLAQMSAPPEGVENYTVRGEVMEGGTRLTILIQGLDEPAQVRLLSAQALIPYTAGDYLSYEEAEAQMSALGYVMG